jgi:hypothetical protein
VRVADDLAPDAGGQHAGVDRDAEFGFAFDHHPDVVHRRPGEVRHLAQTPPHRHLQLYRVECERRLRHTSASCGERICQGADRHKAKREKRGFEPVQGRGR